MFERFTERARQVVVLAQEEARTLKHDYIGTEHILLGLLREEEGVAARALARLDITIEAVRGQIEELVGSGEEVVSGQLPFTPRGKKALELALREALRLGHNYIGTEHILLALARDEEGVAARILFELGSDSEQIHITVIHLLPGPEWSSQQRGSPERGTGAAPAWQRELRTIRRKLTLRPREVPIPRAVGRRLVEEAIRRHDPDAEARLGAEAWDALVEEVLDANPDVEAA